MFWPLGGEAQNKDIAEFVTVVEASDESPTFTDEELWDKGVAIHFPQGKATVIPGDEGFDALEKECRRLAKDGYCICRVVVVRGAASPEGTQQINERLSDKRAELIASKVNQWLNHANGAGVKPKLLISKVVQDYYGLRRLLESSDWPQAKRVVSVIDQGEGDPHKTTELLGRLDDGVVWAQLCERFFPQLRASRVVIVVSKTEPAPAVLPLPTLAAAPRLSPLPKLEMTIDSLRVPVREHKPRKRHLVLYTNLLYDAIAIPNIGVEIYLGKRWSIATDWQYAWWESDKHKRHWKTYGGYVAGRKYFGGKDEYSGHHLGAYGQMLLYNFEWGGRGYMSGDELKNIFHNPTWSTGLEYGYSLPLKSRFCLDFVLGVGYLQGRYHEYLPIDTHYVWQATKMRRWLGPTRLEVNLVWRLGKGGSR